ncbi:hypothetical protein VTI28DRAFT_5865 [Corynascus sepedonium]
MVVKTPSLVDSQPLPVTIRLPPDSKDATMGAKVRVDLADDDRDREPGAGQG